MGAGPILASWFKPISIEWRGGAWLSFFASIPRDVHWESLAVEGGLIEFPEPTATPGSARPAIGAGHNHDCPWLAEDCRSHAHDHRRRARAGSADIHGLPGSGGGVRRRYPGRDWISHAIGCPRDPG